MTKEQLNPKSVQRCLDFANTLDWHASEHSIETIKSYADLVGWARGAGLLNERAAQQLLRIAARQATEADNVLAQARTLREAIYEILVASAHRKTPRSADVATFNAILSEYLAQSQLIRNNEGFTWEWGGSEDALDQMLWGVTRSTVDLLTSPELQRIGQCADDRGCGYLFLDTSKNHTRQWCSMRGCGNRAKARRHYEKVKGEEQ
jgi:predicted RNA-binding Zn ribbon-like protein